MKLRISFALSVVALTLTLALSGCSLGAVGDFASVDDAAAAPTETLAPVVLPATDCQISMRTASLVEKLNNDTELIAKLSACADADLWVEALIEYPGAGAFTSYPVQEAQDLLAMTCAYGMETAPCVHAASIGILG